MPTRRVSAVPDTPCKVGKDVIHGVFGCRCWGRRFFVDLFGGWDMLIKYGRE